ncbi:hypothetical protein Lal_00012999 [Lupinus albus]|nr:hypothetical protein Lal_00012999 [Lupinus albus]
MISGARYSCVPTKDMDRAAVGSATSSGSLLPGNPGSALGFRDFLFFCGKIRGKKQEGWMHTDEGSIHAGWTQNTPPARFEGSPS